MGFLQKKIHLKNCCQFENSKLQTDKLRSRVNKTGNLLPKFNYGWVKQETRVNQTHYTQHLSFTPDQIKSIDYIISETEDLLKKNLSHWYYGKK